MRNVLLIGVVAGLALEGCLDFSQCTWCDGGSGGGWDGGPGGGWDGGPGGGWDGGPGGGWDGGPGSGWDGGPGGGRDGGSDAGCAPNLWNNVLGSYPTGTCAVVQSGFVNGAGVGEFSCDAGALSAGTEFLGLPFGTAICAHANVLPGSGLGKLEVGCFACPADGGCKCSQQSGCVVSTTELGPQTVGPFLIPALNCQTLNVYFQIPGPTGGLLHFIDAWVWQQSGDGGCAWNSTASCPTR